jgi:hypothetical protein
MLHTCKVFPKDALGLMIFHPKKPSQNNEGFLENN